MSNEWAEVRNCNWIHEAHFVKSVLESEGIDVLLPDEYTLGIQPGIGNALGGVKVLVPSKDLQRATELLDAVQIADGVPEADGV